MEKKIDTYLIVRIIVTSIFALFVIGGLINILNNAIFYTGENDEFAHIFPDYVEQHKRGAVMLSIPFMVVGCLGVGVGNAIISACKNQSSMVEGRSFDSAIKEPMNRTSETKKQIRCESCGGILDDTNKCPYCGTRVR